MIKVVENKLVMMEEVMVIKIEKGIIEFDLIEVIIVIGEKISFCCFEVVEKVDNVVFGVYLYMGGCIVVLIVIDGIIDEEVVKDVVMYIVVINFCYVNEF